MEREALQGAIRRAVTGSFNRITVDGDQSPATRCRCWPTAWPRTGRSRGATAAFGQFQQALEALTQRLAVMLVEDGEGATLVIEVRVRGARTRGEALSGGPVRGELAAGQDGHGRRRPQLGPDDDGAGQAAGAAVQEDRVAIWFGEEQVAAGGRLREGVALGPGQGGAGQARGIRSTVDLGLGSRLRTTCGHAT